MNGGMYLGTKNNTSQEIIILRSHTMEKLKKLSSWS